MKKMKAFVRTEALSQEVKLENVPRPDIQADEVLIKVEAFGVGIHDRYYIPQDAKFPYVVGTEGAGVVAQLGKEVMGYALGDRVIFTTILLPQGGAWAEYAATKATALISLPDNLTFVEGASIPIVAKTVLECMRALKLEKGDKLFIAGGSGAIGTLAIQLANKQGVEVSASASEKNHGYMESFGVQKAVDYNNQNWTDQVIEWSKNGVDAALAIQPGTEKDSIKVVKDGGRMITVSNYNNTITPERNIFVKQLEHHESTQQKVIELVNTIAKGEIKLVIEKEYPFEQALEALEKTETRHARGKLVVYGLN